MARFNLPDIDFLEVDPEELESLAVSKFEELQGVSLSDADPRRKFIQSIVFVASIMANNIDFTAKQNLLAYAVDDYLDHLAVKKDVFRLEPIAAETIIRFEVESPDEFIIPAGTRLSVNDLFFATTEDKTISPNETFADIPAACEVEGSMGNGFLPGQISSLVDPLPWVSKAYNLTKTEGGVDWEDDEAFAERTRQSNSKYSTAGPEDAYYYHAMSASSSITDVSVSSPSEGTILIIPLLQNGDIPDQTILDQVYEKTNDKRVRPLTDYVLVQKPEEVFYEINLTYYVPADKANVLSSIQTAVNQAVENYQLWQRSKLGRGIDSSELNSLIKEAGGSRITIDSPTSYVPLEKKQVAKASKVTVSFGGILND